MCQNCANTVNLPDDEATRDEIRQNFRVIDGEPFVAVGAAQEIVLETVLATLDESDMLAMIKAASIAKAAINLVGAMAQKAIEMDAADGLVASLPEAPEAPQNTQLF